MKDTLRRISGPAGSAALRAIARSWRFTEIDATSGRPMARVRRPGHHLYALWHQHLLMLALLYRDEQIAVMISRSRDGDVASRLVERLGYRVERGSSSRGGSEALRGMLDAAAAGHPLALTVDGPRGPARVCKPGAVLISGRSGIPILPVVAVPQRGRALDSWDRFLLPAPGSRILVGFGEPILARSDDSEDEVSVCQRRVEREMERVTDLCEVAAGACWPRGRDT